MAQQATPTNNDVIDEGLMVPATAHGQEPATAGV